MLFDFDPDGGGGVGAPQFAFGVQTVTHSFWFHFGVSPTQWYKIGSGGGGGVLGVDLEDEGVAVPGNPHAILNFVGAGVTATDVAGVGTITVPGGISGIVVEDEGAPIAGNPHSTVNFVGSGVTASDVAGVATVTIPGGISGIVVEDEGAPIAGNPHSTVNFVGAGVTGTDVAGVATVTIPGGSGPQVFFYTVTGAEPDLSALVIPIPVATADVNYAVVATCQGAVGIVPFDIPNASKTTTHFVAIATGDLTAADAIAFFLSPLT
jgi:hypothetical protein